ncbi:unnamed protein product [Angiostrongylus costaricensis]|uniref:Uncharacterized protein n=1 Tax=Angiostrongylus costaricensis TaxID=334426 RepID=A0A0R3P9L4_ANGCS|nr:unnamed protein product [Angiostrongylus costaricensis]VDM55790.1 unnamed protein product [Angiostrongylus costaricensis]
MCCSPHIIPGDVPWLASEAPLKRTECAVVLTPFEVMCLGKPRRRHWSRVRVLLAAPHSNRFAAASLCGAPEANRTCCCPHTIPGDLTWRASEAPLSWTESGGRFFGCGDDLVGVPSSME